MEYVRTNVFNQRYDEKVPCAPAELEAETSENSSSREVKCEVSIPP